MNDLRLKIPMLKLEEKSAHEKQAALLTWITKMERYLTFYHCINPVKRNLVPEANDILQGFGNEEEFDAAVAAGYAPVNQPDLVLAWDGPAGYRAEMNKQVAELQEIQKALAALTAGLGSMALQYYIAIHPAEAENPYLIMNRIKADLFRPSSSVVMIKRQEFNSLAIRIGESAEEFAIRVRNATYELSVIDHLNPISEERMVQQMNFGITHNPTYKTVFLGSQNMLLGQPSVEELARQFTNLCQLARLNPVQKRDKKILRVNNSYGESSVSKSSSSASGKGPRCWYCGKYGHLWTSHGDEAKGKKLRFRPTVSSSNSDNRIKSLKNKKAKKSSKGFIIKVTRVSDSRSVRKILRTVSDRQEREGNLVLFDTAAEVSAFKKTQKGMKITDENPNSHLVFGNNTVSKVSKIAAFGGLDNIHINKDLSDNVISIASLCKKGYKAIFTKGGMYLFSRDTELQVKEGHILLKAKRMGGVYGASVSDIMKAILEEDAENDDGDGIEIDRDSHSSGEETVSEEEVIPQEPPSRADMGREHPGPRTAGSTAPKKKRRRPVGASASWTSSKGLIPPGGPRPKKSKIGKSNDSVEWESVTSSEPEAMADAPKSSSSSGSSSDSD